MERSLIVSHKDDVIIVDWKVAPGSVVSRGTILALYRNASSLDESDSLKRLKCSVVGKVSKLHTEVGSVTLKGKSALELIVQEECLHATVIKDLCCDCGVDLRKESEFGNAAPVSTATVPILHHVPELRVSAENAEMFARQDERRLLLTRRLALIVDLDQTLVHSTLQDVPADMPDVFHFQPSSTGQWYHAKLRSGSQSFLAKMAQKFELHVFSMGSRLYAHSITQFLDPDQKLFAHRIRSRDECRSPFTKSLDMRCLFPLGDSMVCIIDDREDVWNGAPNLVRVKPYFFFQETGDINDPFASTVPHPREGSPDTLEGPPAVESQPIISVQDWGNTTLMAEDSSIGDRDQQTDGEGSGPGSSACTVPSSSKESADTEECPSPMSVMGTHDKSASESVSLDMEKTDLQVLGAGPSDLGSAGPHNSPADDNYLDCLAEILFRIHGAFYGALDTIKDLGGTALKDSSVRAFCTPGSLNPDTRCIVPRLRERTLQGVVIVFSGVVPTNSRSQNHAAYRVARLLGAEVLPDLVLPPATLSTTHLVAARVGTEKVHRASKHKHIHVVSLTWLWECYDRWERVDEDAHPLSTHLDPRVILPPGMSLSRMSRAEESALDGTRTAESPKEDTPVESTSGLSDDDRRIMAEEVEDALDSDSEDELVDELQEEELRADGTGSPNRCTKAVSRSSHSSSLDVLRCVSASENDEDADEDSPPWKIQKTNSGGALAEDDPNSDSSSSDQDTDGSSFDGLADLLDKELF